MEFGHRVWKFYVEDWFGKKRMTDLGKLLALLEEAVKIEKKIEEALASEADKKRREKLEKAFKDKGLSVDERRALIASVLYDN